MKAYFNEMGYYYESEGRQGSRTFEYSEGFDAYAASWNSALTLLVELHRLGETNEQVVVYNNSRLVEELRGQVPPDSNYGKACLAYLKAVIFPEFVWLEIKKTTGEKLAQMIDVIQGRDRETEKYR